ncbi:MAG: hypothetical protein KF860_10165 [Cyclobacteriaceae bacterium]|nr:hypothetical protein [Cyclobacteriaceae bacterium]
MKKKFYVGLVLIGTSFLAVAFTKSVTSSNSYIQKPNNCEAIPLLECLPIGNVECTFSDGTGTYRAYMARTNAAQCKTPLFRNE